MKEIVTNSAVLSEPPKATHSQQQRRTFLTRYWGEVVVVTIAVLLWLPRLSGPIDLRWDGAVYYLLGTSLAQGHGYRIPSEPGSPQALQYPPLLPAFVALHQRAWAQPTWFGGAMVAKIVRSALPDLRCGRPCVGEPIPGTGIRGRGDRVVPASGGNALFLRPALRGTSVRSGQRSFGSCRRK